MHRPYSDLLQNRVLISSYRNCIESESSNTQKLFSYLSRTVKTTIRTIIISGLLGFLLVSCKQDIGGANWDVDILAPVIRTELTMADLLADSLLYASSNGALRLKVERPLIDLTLDSILRIPDTTIVKSFSLLGSLTDVPPGFELQPLDENTQYELDEIALKELRVKSGSLKLFVKSIVKTAIDFEFSIPTATKYGVPFFSVGRVEAAGPLETDTAFAELEFDLSGYNIDLRGESGSSFNTLTSSFKIRTALDGDTVSIPGGGETKPFLILDYGFTDVVPNYGLGYFGQVSNTEDNQKTDLDVLDRIVEGQMFLDSITIGLSVTNAVGADARFKLDRLSSINNRTNSTVDLQHDIVGSNILLTRAQDPTGIPADIVPYTLNFEFNNANSNIIGFIENLPDQLDFSFGFDLNPLGNVSGGNDFFYYERPFQAIMNIDVPLRTTLSNLTLVDTIDWNLSETGVVESVNGGTFTLKAVNGFPLEGLVELIMLDENLNELGSLVAPSTIAAPQLNSENKVISPLESVVIIPINEETTNVLPQTKKVRIMVRFNTPNPPQFVEFYDTYGIDLKLIGNFNLNFETSSF